MEYNKELVEKLITEMVDLVFECKIRSQKIEDLAKQLKIIKE